METNNSANNRSEELRKRRAQQTQKRMNVVNNRVVNPVNPRPVVVRGGGFGTPIHRQAGTRARRQFYVTVDQAAGSEVRLPALPIFHPGWRLLSGLIALLAGIGIFSLYNSPFFRVTTVDLRGTQRVTAEDLNTALNLVDKPVIELNQEDIQAKVATAFPELVNVNLTIDMPNFVTITAVERQPVLVWKKGDQTRWVDAEGFVFPARGEAGKLVALDSQSDLPMAPGPVTSENEADSKTVPNTGTEGQEANKTHKNIIPAPTEQVNPGLISAAQALSQKLPPETTLVFDQANGLGWSDPQGCKIFIGRDLNQFEAKYTMYQEIATVLNDQGLQPALISVEQLNAPFYRLEQ